MTPCRPVPAHPAGGMTIDAAHAPAAPVIPASATTTAVARELRAPERRA